MSTYQPFPSFVEWITQSGPHQAFDTYAARFREVGDDARAESSRLMTRSAAVDTNAIEGIYHSDRGFTRTIAEAAAGWEQTMQHRGAHVRPAFDDAMNGYQFILDVATGRRELSQQLIRELHATMTASQDTFTVETAVGPQAQALPHGQYKTMPNSPTTAGGTIHAYAPVEDTPPDMARLIGECTSVQFTNAHPVDQASYIHYAFVCVHPFADGNGRVSRALASIYLYRNPGIPLVVFQDQRNNYYDCLEAADKGNFGPFIGFIGQRALDSVQLALESLPTTPSAEHALQQLAADGSNSPSQMSLVPGGQRLKEAVFTGIKSRLSALPTTPVITFTTSNRLFGEPGTSAGYAHLPSHELQFSLLATDESAWMVAECFTVLVRDTAPAESPEYLVVSSPGYSGFTPLARPLEVFRRDLEPTLKETLRLRIEMWGKNVVDGFVSGAVESYRNLGR